MMSLSFFRDFFPVMMQKPMTRQPITPPMLPSLQDIHTHTHTHTQGWVIVKTLRQTGVGTCPLYNLKDTSKNVILEIREIEVKIFVFLKTLFLAGPRNGQDR